MRDALLFVLAGVAALVYLLYTLTRGTHRARSRWEAGGDVGITSDDTGGAGHGDCGSDGGDGGCD